jgi:hypothetical protein
MDGKKVILLRALGKMFFLPGSQLNYGCWLSMLKFTKGKNMSKGAVPRYFCFLFFSANSFKPTSDGF